VEVGVVKDYDAENLNNPGSAVSPSPVFRESRGLSDFSTIWRKEKGMTESTAHDWENSESVPESTSKIGKGRTDEDPPPPSTTGSDSNLVTPKVKGGDDDEDGNS
jgi:hypothetical protein